MSGTREEAEQAFATGFAQGVCGGGKASGIGGSGGLEPDPGRVDAEADPGRVDLEPDPGAKKEDPTGSGSAQLLISHIIIINTASLLNYTHLAIQ